ncbi:HAD-like protein [Plenodomus tracheiphilus IPT5]|uniref:HAD-like protein n=1 Tax=Plenodomus tracheiphilus IPT5 TaxID=1408161 RepID=A0A6A7B033_9PLEO|nr:HAD-like protein [Plenodomus tracheiphilus IPT5]
MTKSASFDVIGTCFGFSVPITAISRRLGPSLAAHSIDAKTLFFAWFYAAQRDFTYTSICGSYTPIAEILKSTFRRACRIVDIPGDAVSDEDVSEIMIAFRSMQPREGLKECYDGLRAVGWDVYAVTNGSVQTSLDYYLKANVGLDRDHLLSCDDLKVAKPDRKVYENANRYLNSRGVSVEGDGERWFVAAHSWDLIAARKAGFRTAWLGVEEREPVTEVFGEFDIYAKDMEELLKKMKEVK